MSNIFRDYGKSLKSKSKLLIDVKDLNFGSCHASNAWSWGLHEVLYARGIKELVLVSI